MMKSLLLVLVIVGSISSVVPGTIPAGVLKQACEDFPNGTDTAVRWWNCNNADVVQVSAMKVENSNGQEEYPVDVDQLVILDLTQTNSGPQIDKTLADAAIWQWNTGPLGCRWGTIPTLGLTNNMDGCKDGGCPIKAGSGNMKLTLDLSEFQPIINLMPTGKPYQLRMKVKDASNKKEVACVYLQMKITKG